MGAPPPRRSDAMSRPLLPFAVAAILLAAAPASAQQASGFSLDRFDPSERGSEWFALDSLDLRGSGRPAIGLVVDYAYKPLVLYDQDHTERASLVQDQLFVHAGGSLVLWSRVRIGANLPIAVYQTGDSARSGTTSFAAPDTTTIGDLRLSADLRLIGEYRTPFSLAAGVAVHVPTGNRDAYTSDGSVRVEPRLLAAGEAGVFVYAAKVGFAYRGLDEAFAGSSRGSEVVFGASAGVRAARGRLVLGPEVFGATVVSGDEGAFKTRNTPFEAILGAHYTLAGGFRFGGGVGPGLTRGYGAPALRALASLEWAPDADRDGDGIADGSDACPSVPGIKTDDPRTNGCPSDRDGDAILDDADACPDRPGIKTDDPKTNGCPPPPSDRDTDAIVDADDACPDQPGIKTDDPKTNGCPPPPPDRDKDSIADADDACPDQPGVKTDDPKTNGCPPPPADTDKDGIVDPEDACPADPGPRDPDPKKNGCPKAVIVKGQIKIFEQIKFRFNSAELDPASDPILGAVLKILKEHDDVQKLRIEGHTDNKGNDAYNKKLSDGRARAVLKWLVAHGVAAARLTSEGFGAAQPLESNATEEGRRSNRRGEFHITAGANAETPPATPPAPPKP
jgi:outer membrane protein OmpA-like peptidoglycan-associated protein